MDPANSDFDATGIMYARAFYDPLLATAADGSSRPYLAESVTHNPDYTVWTIVARAGVTFHDGTDFDANAMAANFHAHLASPITGAALDPMVDDVIVVGPQAVEIRMKSPWVPFDSYLCGWVGGQFAYMASPKAIAGGSLGDHPVGTGPFVFGGWEPNQHMTGTRNGNYWRSGMPYVDSVTFRPMPDEQERANAMLAGDIDAMHTTDVSHYLEARAGRGFSYVDNLRGEVGEPDQQFLMVNTRKAPYDDLRLRQALAYAIDTTTYNRFANQGVTPVDFSPFARGTSYYSDNGYPRYDLAKAKALVADYVAEKGGPVTIDLGIPGGNSVNTTEMNAMAEMFRRAGFVVREQQVLQAEYILKALQGDYGLFFWRQFGSTDPDQNFNWWSSTMVGPEGGISLNLSRNADPQIDRALSTGRSDPDPAARTAAYRAISERLDVDLPFLWNNRALWAVVAGPNLANYNSYRLPDGSTGLGMKVGVFPIVNAWLT